MVWAAVRGDVARSALAAVLNEGGAIEGRIGIRRADVTSNASGCSITARICGNARYAAFKPARSRIAGRVCCIALYT